MTDSYHHGQLRDELVRIAVECIESDGIDKLSMRDVARRAGVSHAAPKHHFGSKEGLLTAVATRGFALLADELTPSVEAGQFAETAVAYVDFAVHNRAYFTVMFQFNLLDNYNAELTAAREATLAQLRGGFDTLRNVSLAVPAEDARRAAWSMVHGLATLYLGGAFGEVDIRQLVLASAHQLFHSESS